MKISQFKNHLQNIEIVAFQLPDGAFVPAHFHITEIGKTTKSFIDCGGDVHEESFANLQIWVADDFDHRLKAANLLKILELSERVLRGEDLEIEVEYQRDTIGKYALDFQENRFLLLTKHTDCLAKIKCNIPFAKPKKRLSDLTVSEKSCCAPGSGCC